MHLQTGSLGLVLERKKIGRDVAGNADQALAIKRVGQSQLVARDRSTADAQERARLRKFCSRRLCRRNDGDAQLCPPER